MIERTMLILVVLLPVIGICGFCRLGWLKVRIQSHRVKFAIASAFEDSSHNI
jgi:hypothetical protein